MYGIPGIICGKFIGYSEQHIAGVLDSENCCIVSGRWTVDCGLGTYGGLWLVGKRDGEQLMPPSIALLSIPTSRRLLSVFPWVLL